MKWRNNVSASSGLRSASTWLSRDSSAIVAAGYVGVSYGAERDMGFCARIGAENKAGELIRACRPCLDSSKPLIVGPGARAVEW
jgi:hypothetical protein